MQVRKARLTDSEAMFAVQQDAGYNAWSKQQIEQVIERQQAFVLLNPAQTVLAFALFSTVLDETELLNIVVQSTSQQQGLGKYLLQDCLQYYQGQGVSRCLLELAQSNNKAYKLYQQLGFVTEGLRKNYYQTLNGKDDALLMSLYFKGES